MERKTSLQREVGVEELLDVLSSDELREVLVWAAEWRQRISGATLEHDVAAKLRASPARCADQTRNGSRWACLVGSGQGARCVVVDVSITGSWSLERRPAQCRYP